MVSPSTTKPKLVLLATTIAAFMGPFDANIVNLALPNIGGSLHAQLSYLIWIPVAYLLVSASLQATMGWLGDITGRKKIFALGIFLFTLGSALASLSNNVLILILNRVIQGAGAASMSSSSAAIVTDTFRRERGRALGINISATYIGLTLGPIVGGFLVQPFGWRSIFYVNIPIGIASLLLAFFYLPKDSSRIKQVNEHFDIAGSVALSLFLVTLMLFVSQNDLALAPFEILLLGGVCAGSFAGFILNESRFAKKPIIDLGLFTHNRLFAAGNATAVFNYLTFGGTIFIMPLYLQLVRGYSPSSAGLILFAQPVVQALTAPVAGILSDRIDSRILSSVGMFSRSVGLLALSFLG
ncbi:MAG: MFS transporter, partial [Nitrososphaerales archaeon]